ncbi:unnamed protein product [Blepharisma stoltei]|uniref:Uncharacterized protein n=1 Tax=Blepharisma stoltei TaxID=1481888 RepID=A0AAU9J8W1_9CILI|nr:unnamed protein product [Blepharisma stoltei]
MSYTFTPKQKFTPKMISRIGKNSADRFMILGQRDEIVSGKSRQKQFRFAPDEDEDLKESLMINELIKKEEMAHDVSEDNSPKIPKLSPAFRAQTREDYYRNISGKNCAPPCGHYNPSFEITQKHIQSPRLKKTKIEIRQATTAQKQFRHKIKKEKNFSNSHLQSAIPFNKQLKRGSFHNISVNEQRFVQQNLSPEICTKFKKVTVPDISKQLARKEFYRVSDCAPEYKPNKEPFLKKLIKSFSLDKSIGRKDENLKHIPDPYDVNYSLVTQRQLNLDFSKLSGREKYSNCPLPSFMQGVNSRISLEAPSNLFSSRYSNWEF